MTKLKLRSTSPFVGLGGTLSTITVRRDRDRIVCHLSTWAYVLVLASTALFGPGLLALLWLRPSGTIDLARQPVLLAAAILLIPVMCCALLARHLLTRHRFEVSPSSGAINFFKHRRGRPSFSLSLHAINRLEVIEEWYRSSRGMQVKNYVLCAHGSDGKRTDLCISTEEQLILALKSDIERMK